MISAHAVSKIKLVTVFSKKQTQLSTAYLNLLSDVAMSSILSLVVSDLKVDYGMSEVAQENPN